MKNLKNMSVNEFIADVRTRQEILIELKTNKNHDERMEMLKELIDIQGDFLTPDQRDLKFKQREECVHYSMMRRLELHSNDIRRFVDENIGEGFSIRYTDKFRGYGFVIKIIDSKGKKYKLFDVDDGYADLKMLYSVNYYKDWNKLFNQDPNLKERIWTWVKENIINKNKRERITLIQKKITERNKEIENLRNPKYIENKINELKKQNEEAVKEIEEKENNLYYVGF